MRPLQDLILFPNGDSTAAITRTDPIPQRWLHCGYYKNRYFSLRLLFGYLSILSPSLSLEEEGERGQHTCLKLETSAVSWLVAREGSLEEEGERTVMALRSSAVSLRKIRDKHPDPQHWKK
jgi:hypothetical protein